MRDLELSSLFPFKNGPNGFGVGGHGPTCLFFKKLSRIFSSLFRFTHAQAMGHSHGQIHSRSSTSSLIILRSYAHPHSVSIISQTLTFNLSILLSSIQSFSISRHLRLLVSKVWSLSTQTLNTTASSSLSVLGWRQHNLHLVFSGSRFFSVR